MVGNGSIEEDIQSFLAEWRNKSAFVQVRTSGSTGSPKEMLVDKERMRNSARLTCSFLGLRTNDTALLCMSPEYIAGKMMIVRSEVAKLKLLAVNPTGHPLEGLDENDLPIHLAAMVPLQVYNSLHVKREREFLQKIGILLIGGGSIDPAMETDLKSFPGAIYSTYGMTETLSHIALRRLNGKEASPYYTPFPSIRLALSEEGTLIIDAPEICGQQLITNDIATLLPDGRFSILGRKDNIVNSGGIKIQIEQVEEVLRNSIAVPYAISSVPDPKLGEALTLLVENNRMGMEPEALRETIKALLPRYERPKHIVEVEEIPHTETGKIDRAAARRLAIKRIF